MRLVYGAASVAALSVLTVGLSHPAPPAPVEVAFDANAQLPPATDPPAPAQTLEVTHLINYVHLLPGQTAPPGATVIAPDAPAPKVVVTTVPAPTAKPVAKTTTTTTTTKTTVKTRQSGKP
jgi:hypothetical protein